MMSPDYTESLGLKVAKAINRNCGRFKVPGSGTIHDYAGVIAEPFELRLRKEVKFTIMGMKLIANPYSLALIGADVLKAARPGMWNYLGIDPTEDGSSRVLKFGQGKQSELLPLFQVPQAPDGGQLFRSYAK